MRVWGWLAGINRPKKSRSLGGGGGGQSELCNKRVGGHFEKSLTRGGKWKLFRYWYLSLFLVYCPQLMVLTIVQKDRPRGCPNEQTGRGLFVDPALCEDKRGYMGSSTMRDPKCQDDLLKAKKKSTLGYSKRTGETIYNLWGDDHTKTMGSQHEPDTEQPRLVRKFTGFLLGGKKK